MKAPSKINSSPDTLWSAALVLPRVLRRAMERHALRGSPSEVCGLLLGRPSARGALVRCVYPARNVNQDRPHERFELYPGDVVAAEQAAREADQEVLGVYHSHPGHHAVPSAEDRKGAWSGWSYAILSVLAGEVREVRSWLLVDGAFDEQMITLEDHA
jgi:proteasome lid subunit RPN8/RPN11